MNKGKKETTKNKYVGVEYSVCPKEQKGITLIALIITIIVMLILVAVVVRTAINSGLFGHAQNATEKWSDAQEKEVEINIDDQISDYAGGRTEELNFPEGKVARIEKTYYSTLQSAVDAVSEDKKETTIYLLTSVEENVKINENRNIVLRIMNNSKLENGAKEESTILLDGTLVVRNGEITANCTAKVATIEVNENANLICNMTNITRTSNEGNDWETIAVRGKVTINSGTITNLESNVICAYDDCTPEINIKGGNITGISKMPTIYNSKSATLNISGGTVLSQKGSVMDNFGNVVITGGELSSTAEVGKPTLFNSSTGTMSISGGKITSENDCALHNIGTIEEISGTANIINNSPGAATFYNRGEATIKGGTIRGSQAYAIYNTGAAAKITIGGNVKITNNSEKTTVFNLSGAHLIITGGNIRNDRTDGYAVYNEVGNATVEVSGNPDISKTNF